MIDDGERDPSVRPWCMDSYKVHRSAAVHSGIPILLPSRVYVYSSVTYTRYSERTEHRSGSSFRLLPPFSALSNVSVCDTH
eukprot:6691602-Prymnesium_polylepis.1